MIFLRSKAFFLLEAVVALAVLIAMASVLTMATSYTVHFFAQARLMHRAVLYTSQVLDEALFNNKPEGEISIDGYTVILQKSKELCPICSVTTSWEYNHHIQTITLRGVSCQELQ